MKALYTFFALLLFSFIGRGQTVTVSGACMSGSIDLTKETANVEGKVAYTGIGTVLSTPNTQIAIYWIGAPDNVWVLAFDGQPYFQSACNTALPPGTSNAPSCPWSEVTAGSCTGGSPLAISGTGTLLPVRFISFKATKTGASVELAWTTGFESNNKGYEVQRSSDGIQWTKLGFVNGAGNSSSEKNYRYTDAAPATGKNYYRLLQHDLDNGITYTKTISVDFAKAFYSLQKTSNGVYRVSIEMNGPAELAVFDLGGRKLFSKKASQGLHQVDIRSFAEGIYLLQLNVNNQVTTERLIKN